MRVKTLFVHGVAGLLCAGLLGCGAAGPKYLAKDFAPPRKVAVLPFTNDTNDVTGPETVRKVLLGKLPSRGYQLIPKERVDDVLLKEFGITEGGQLNSVTPQELGEALKADGLMYGNLIVFMDLPFGFGRKRTVKAEFKLVDSKTGERLWEDKRGWTTPELHLDPKEARAAAVRQVAERQIEKMTNTFLLKESQIVVDAALRNLPLGR